MGDIAIIGTGYVGLTTGACFAHLGHNVICADVVPEKIERLQRGEIPILEAGLEDLVREGLQSGRLRFVLGAANAVKDSEFHYLCVPTPQGEDGSADLTYIESAAAEISPLLAPGSIVVNKSTVPVGSTRRVEEALGRSDVFVVSNPEFLREGTAVSDFLHPDRVVIGSDDQSAAIRVAALYIGVAAPLMVTDPASAETIKYASNAFLATKLSFVNAVAAVCEAVGADANDVVLGMGYDKRIGHEFLRPGPGWGGSCFPKDTRALIHIAEEAGYDFDLLKGVVTVNDEQFARVANKVVEAAGG
ncbi:MAG: UDP-glucose dehydrogenase family protein, partial [Acidimicrobiales bacterium]